MEIADIGRDWIADRVGCLTDEIIRLTPSEYNEATRYLPPSVTSVPGYIRYSLTPYLREIVNCFDIYSPVRECNVMKGVQVGYSTVLESGALYFLDHVKTLPIMLISADKELVNARMEQNIVPMIHESGLSDIIQSADVGNTKKSGKTANHIQVVGGGYLIPFGAKNPDKMRTFSICILLKDETDAWPEYVGKDGCPDGLTDDRCKAYWERRKIFRGSTPLIMPGSKIHSAFMRGDRRQYMVLCRHCNFPQQMRWTTTSKNGIVGGFKWEMEDNTLLTESVRYHCSSCGHAHEEHDKIKLFAEEEGAHWKPTAKPEEKHVRSYQIPAFISELCPWYKNVTDYLAGWDVVNNRIKDIGKYQKFYNNVLAKPFTVRGSKVRFESVSAHRRHAYKFGEVPNKYAVKQTGGPILLLTCQVDVHKNNLAVSVMGWTRDARCFVIDYWRFETNGQEPDECTEIGSSVWPKLRRVMEESRYVADDGKIYGIEMTLIDSGYANDTVITFCNDYATGVFPILGRERPGKNQRIQEFGEFETKIGTTGFKIVVDHYKDRIAPVLRREWSEDTLHQLKYHFNVPWNMTDEQLKELTVEVRMKKVDDKGGVTYPWYRPGNAFNELWDLLGYGYCAVDIIAWSLCIQQFGLDSVDWTRFWDYIETEKLYFIEPE